MRKRMITVILSLVMILMSSVSVLAISNSRSGYHNGITYTLTGNRTSQQAYSEGVYGADEVTFCVYIRAYFRGNDDTTETNVLRNGQGEGTVRTPTIGAPNDSYIDSIYTYLQFGTTRVGAFWV